MHEKEVQLHHMDFSFQCPSSSSRYKYSSKQKEKKKIGPLIL